MTTKGLALAAEVCAVLARYPDLRCAPTVAEEDGQVRLSVTFHAADTAQALRTLELYGELRYLAGLAQVRGFATDYGIDPAALERLLDKPGKERDAET